MLAGIVLRIWWMEAVDPQPVTDFHWYYERALSILAGDGYSMDGQPTAYWPPGTSFALAAWMKVVGASISAARWLGLLASCLLLPAVWLLATRLGLGLAGSGFAVIWVALDPRLVIYGSLISSESLYSLLLVLGALLVAASPRNWLGTGILLGFAALLRPQALLLIPGFTAGRRHWLMWSLVALVGAGAVLAPWTIRSFKVFGKPIAVSTNGGDNLLIGATGAGYADPDGIGTARPAWWSETRRDSAARAEAWGTIGSNPIGWILKAPKKLQLTFLTFSDAPYWGMQSSTEQPTNPWKGGRLHLHRAMMSLCSVTGVGLLVLAGLGVWRTRKSPLWLAMMPVLTTGLVVMMFFGNPRFAIPCLPFLALLAGAAVADQRCIVNLVK